MGRPPDVSSVAVIAVQVTVADAFAAVAPVEALTTGGWGAA